MSKDVPAGTVEEPLVYRTRIKDWPLSERPREKLLKNGPAAMSDAELLAILIRTGTGKRTALDLAQLLLSKERSLRAIGMRSASELMRMPGIGSAKAVELLSAFEIARRIQCTPDDSPTIIRSPEDVRNLMGPKLRDLTREVFHVLVLDSRNAVKDDVELSRGIVNASLVHPREVFKIAIDRLAAAVVVVHNHPSGNAEPSREDLEITNQLADAGFLLGIPLHDHVIIAGTGYTSLAERGVL
jgi:DNA repair protein RadC